MKTADLYIRVSTDEQAEKGFSVKYQEDVLRRHCLINSIQVQNVYFEDFPARNFKRPTWSSLLIGYKPTKPIDRIMFFLLNGTGLAEI